MPKRKSTPPFIGSLPVRTRRNCFWSSYPRIIRSSTTGAGFPRRLLHSSGSWIWWSRFPGFLSPGPLDLVSGFPRFGGLFSCSGPGLPGSWIPWSELLELVVGVQCLGSWFESSCVDKIRGQVSQLLQLCFCLTVRLLVPFPPTPSPILRPQQDCHKQASPKEEGQQEC